MIILGRPKKRKEVARVSKRSITAMSKLATVEATVKSLVVAIDDDKKQGKLLGWMMRDRYYIETMVATVKATVNMEQFSDDQTKIDSVQRIISITLPQPTVEKANILQEKSTVVWKKGTLGKDFKTEELINFRKQKQNEIDSDPKIQQAVIQQAKQNTEEFFVAWLKTMGYTDANIYFK